MVTYSNQRCYYAVLNSKCIPGGNIDFYVNGIHKGASLAPSALDLTNLEHFNLGYNQDAMSVAYFAGIELRENVLSGEEIAKLYNRQIFCHSQ